jgi:hypothetical protein
MNTAEVVEQKVIEIKTVNCSVGRHGECFVETAPGRVIFRCCCKCHRGKLFEEGNQ